MFFERASICILLQVDVQMLSYTLLLFFDKYTCKSNQKLYRKSCLYHHVQYIVHTVSAQRPGVSAYWENKWLMHTYIVNVNFLADILYYG